MTAAQRGNDLGVTKWYVVSYSELPGSSLLSRMCFGLIISKQSVLDMSSLFGPYLSDGFMDCFDSTLT